MEKQEIINYIFSDCKQEKIFSPIKEWLNNESYKKFVISYKDKMKKKLRDPKDEEEAKDILFEIKLPYLFLLKDESLDIEYEKYGETVGTDFTITFKENDIVNFEITRIRNPNVDFYKCVSYIESKIIPTESDIRADVSIGSLEPNDYEIFKTNLIQRKENIIEFINQEVLRVQEQSLTPSLEDLIPIPGFEKDYNKIEQEILGPDWFKYYNDTYCSPEDDNYLNLCVYRYTPPKAPSDNRYCNFSLLPIFFTQKEYNKISDKFCDKLRQMKPNMINILVIITDSDTHDRFDFEIAVETFEGKEKTYDYIEKRKILSGALFLKSKNIVKSFDCCKDPVPDYIIEFLEGI